MCFTCSSALDLTLVYFSKICSLLHQRYKDFSPSLIQGLLKVFFPGKSGDDLDADRNLKAMKKRSTLKLLSELYFVGVIEDSGIFMNIIKDLTSLEHLKDRDTTQTNLTLLASFARQGRIFLGLPLSGQEIHEEVMLIACPLHNLVLFITLSVSPFQCCLWFFIHISYCFIAAKLEVTVYFLFIIII